MFSSLKYCQYLECELLEIRYVSFRIENIYLIGSCVEIRNIPTV